MKPCVPMIILRRTDEAIPAGQMLIEERGDEPGIAVEWYHDREDLEAAAGRRPDATSPAPGREVGP